MADRFYKNYLLVLLLAILACNFIDRWALGLVLQDIKADLSLSDTQLGVLSGIAFAMFYSLMGIPIARWVDSGNRVIIISLSAALWSIAVCACGGARGFLQLILLRMAVGIGEAGGFVPGFSLLADYFSRADRPRAMAVYGLGGPLSIVIGYLAAGWLNAHYGWRFMFAALGAPGLLLAALAGLTLREPRRIGVRENDKGAAAPLAHRQRLWEVLATLWRIPTFRELLLCVSTLFFFTYGILQWQPTFFIRSFQLTGAQVGAGFATVYGLGGLLGTYWGGALSARYAAQDERKQLRYVTFALSIAAFVSVWIYLTHSLYLAFTLLAAVAVAQHCVNAPVYATLQTLIPESMRGTAIAVVLLFGNLIGMGFGPLAAGVLSDFYGATVGADSLRFALLTLSPGYFLVPGWPGGPAAR